MQYSSIPFCTASFLRIVPCLNSAVLYFRIIISYSWNEMIVFLYSSNYFLSFLPVIENASSVPNYQFLYLQMDSWCSLLAHWFTIPYLRVFHQSARICSPPDTWRFKDNLLKWILTLLKRKLSLKNKMYSFGIKKERNKNQA